MRSIITAILLMNVFFANFQLFFPLNFYIIPLILHAEPKKISDPFTMTSLRVYLMS
jgi:hypothetical protein